LQNLPQHAFGLLGVRLNQPVLQVSIQAAQRIAVLGRHVPPQRETQFAQDLHRLGDCVTPRENIAGTMRRDGVLHGLYPAFEQHASKFHRRRRRYTARNVLLVWIGGRHDIFRAPIYRATLELFETFFPPAFEGTSPSYIKKRYIKNSYIKKKVTSQKAGLVSSLPLELPIW
jgi:hypothetical protein